MNVVIIKTDDLDIEMFDDRGMLKINLDLGYTNKSVILNDEQLKKLKKLVNSL